MPITATANGKTFTFPDGTPQDQIALSIDEYFAGQQQQQAVAATQQVRDDDGIFTQIGQGLGDGLANIAGLPVDAMESVGNLLIEGANLLPGTEITSRFDGSFGSSKDLKNALSANAAVNTINDTIGTDLPNFRRANAPDSTGETIANIGGQAIPAIASGVSLARSLPQATNLAGRLGQNSAVGFADGVIQSNSEDPTRQLIDGAGGAVLGAGAGEVGNLVIGAFARRSETKQQIAKLIQEGNLSDSRTAKFDVNNVGDLIKVPAAQNAISQGFDEGTVAIVRSGSAGDKSKFGKALSILEKGRNNREFAALNRPTDVVGDSLASRLSVVTKANRKAGQELDGVANSLKGQPVDSTPAVNSFIDDLESIGVKFTDDGTSKINFKDSDLEGLDQIQNMVSRVFNRARNTKAPDAHDVHRLKRFIDQQVTFGKTKDGLSGRAEGILKSFRRNLDEVLDQNFPKYNDVNTSYSTTRQAIDDFQKAAGTSINFSSENLSKSLGTVSRSVLSNNRTRANVIDSINNLEAVALQNGGKFDDSIIKQIVFIDELESAFGSFAPTSFTGEITRGVTNAAGEAALGNNVGAIRSAARGVTDALKGVSDDSRIAALKELLK